MDTHIDEIAEGIYRRHGLDVTLGERGRGVLMQSLV